MEEGEEEGEEEERGLLALWDAASDAKLLAAVVEFWRSGPKKVPWRNVLALLPPDWARTQGATMHRYSLGRRLAEGGSQGGQEEAAGLGLPWTAREVSALDAAVAEASLDPTQSIIAWGYIHSLGVLPGRSKNALSRRWKSLRLTPAAVLAAASAASAASTPAPSAASSASSAPSPFHQLHALRSAGHIDEGTLRVCWLAAAAAAPRA